MNYGFVKVAAAVPGVHLANPKGNIQEIENLIIQAEGKGVEVIVFPELCVTGYSCGDLFGQQMLLEEAELALMTLLDFTRSLQITSIVGLPVEWNNRLLNCAAIVQKGRLLALVPKTYIPNYKEFYEKRWFQSGDGIENEQVMFCGSPTPLSTGIVVSTPSCRFGVEICEDLWSVMPPSGSLALRGADIIFNLSASNDLIGKREYLEGLLAHQSASCLCGYVYASCGFGESTQDVVFGGKAMIYENGTQLASSPLHTLEEQLVISEIDVERLRTERRVNTSFASACTQLHGKTVEVATELFVPREIELSRHIEPLPFVPKGKALENRCEEIFAIQTEGLARRLVHTHCDTVVVGISGGLDSTLALLVCAETFKRLHLDSHGIVAITMPGFGTTDRTHTNAIRLMKLLHCTIREISIVDAVSQHFRDLDINPAVHDTTYENSQARERTQILMDAANQAGGMVIGTGDLSELALGWATYNGDHMSMYGVNCSIPKTLVRHMVEWVANNSDNESIRATLLDICDTPISPELIPAGENGEITQKTEDLVGPYPLHDFFLYCTLRHGFRPAKILYLAEKAFDGEYDRESILHWLTIFFRRFFAQQFKRSCLPDGPKVGSCSLSPRGDWRMPSDAQSAAWLAECERLK